MEAFEIMTCLKEMFQEQARHERFVTTKALTSCKMAPSTSVSAHILKMKGYIDTLEKLDVPIQRELATDLILGSLPESYDQFVIVSVSPSPNSCIWIFYYIYMRHYSSFYVSVHI